MSPLDDFTRRVGDPAISQECGIGAVGGDAGANGKLCPNLGSGCAKALGLNQVSLVILPRYQEPAIRQRDHVSFVLVAQSLSIGHLLHSSENITVVVVNAVPNVGVASRVVRPGDCPEARPRLDRSRFASPQKCVFVIARCRQPS